MKSIIPNTKQKRSRASIEVCVCDDIALSAYFRKHQQDDVHRFSTRQYHRVDSLIRVLMLLALLSHREMPVSEAFSFGSLCKNQAQTQNYGVNRIRSLPSSGASTGGWYISEKAFTAATRMPALPRCSGPMLCSTSFAGDYKNAESSANHDERSQARNVPRHVAFICDGNSRWAKQRNLPTSSGHLEGANRLVELLDVLHQDGIEYCTLYGFSTENWTRPGAEIQEIFRVIEQTARRLVPRMLGDSSTFQIKLIGNLQDPRIPKGLRRILEELQKITEKNLTARSGDHGELTVCLAVNYGGRQDILQASQKMAVAVASKELALEDVTELTLESFLSTAGIPDPDMIVRTSGEHRLSNFLLWNCAYSEIYVTNVLWPDFDKASWKQALDWYQERHRRFGSRVLEPPPLIHNSQQETNTGDDIASESNDQQH